MSAESWQYSAAELARRIAARETTAAEVVEAHLDRIAAVNPALNAIVVVHADEARAAARDADRAVAAGGRLGPLHGVPVTIKENIDVAGGATTMGVPAFAGAIAPADAPIVAACEARARSRWAGRTCPTWGSAYTRTVPCAARPATPGTRR